MTESGRSASPGILYRLIRMRHTRVGNHLVLFLCILSLFSFHTVYADVTVQERAALEAQLVQVQAQITQNQQKLAEEQSQEASLDTTLSVLDSQITEAQLEIKQRNLTIQELKDGISEDNQGISALDTSVVASQTSLAQIMRDTQQMDDMSFVELALGGTLTDLFQDADDFMAIKKAMAYSFSHIATQRSDLSTHESALENQQQEQSDLLQLQVVQQNSLQSIEQQKQSLLAQTKGQESAYQQVIADRQKSVTQIEQALFSLADTNKSVSFGDIYADAKEAGAATNVRPALILGILAEESGLGQNVGTGNWKTDMSPANQPLFQTLCQGLGLDPNTQKVSARPWYGWGGAMGPAQFIPSTWNQYASRISNITGQTPPNPWDPRTAAFATALLMMDNGADAKTPAAERLAALRYLAGWAHANNPAYAFYGNDVMSLAAKYQTQIDQVNGS